MLGAESRESARSSGRMCTSVVHGPGRFRGTPVSAERRLAPVNVPTRARKVPTRAGTCRRARQTCRTGRGSQAGETAWRLTSAASRSPIDCGVRPWPGGRGSPGRRPPPPRCAGPLHVAQVVQQQRHRQHRRRRVRDALAGDVRRAAVHRLEHARVAPAHVEVAAGRQADAAGDRGGEVGEDVAEQVVGDDHVEPAGVGHHVDRGRVDVLVGDRDVRVLQRHLLDQPRPQRARVGQHVGLVHQREVLAGAALGAARTRRAPPARRRTRC